MSSGKHRQQESEEKADRALEERRQHTERRDQPGERNFRQGAAKQRREEQGGGGGSRGGGGGRKQDRGSR